MLLRITLNLIVLFGLVSTAISADDSEAGVCSSIERSAQLLLKNIFREVFISLELQIRGSNVSNRDV